LLVCALLGFAWLGFAWLFAAVASTDAKFSSSSCPHNALERVELNYIMQEAEKPV
jgi:hypothetical protein